MVWGCDGLDRSNHAVLLAGFKERVVCGPDREGWYLEDELGRSKVALSAEKLD